jgi:hypothetical protein
MKSYPTRKERKMKTRLMMIASALLASLICLPASAQPAQGPGGMGGGMNGMGPGGGAGMMQGGQRARAPRDCSQAPNPAACTAQREARTQAREACKNTAGPQRRQCMQEQRQNVDCAKAGNPQQCEARKMAYKECQGQTGRLQQSPEPGPLRATPKSPRRLSGQNRPGTQSLPA